MESFLHRTLWSRLAGWVWQAVLLLSTVILPINALARGPVTLFSDKQAVIWTVVSTMICAAWFAAALVVMVLLHRKTVQHAAAEDALKDMLAFQTSVLDAIPQPIYLRDTNLNLMTCNSAYERILHASKSKLMSASMANCAARLSAGIELEALEADYRYVMASGLPICKDRAFVRDGQHVDTHHWIEPLRNARGTLVGVVSGWIDISERQRVLRELAVAKDRAESANRTKTTFLASVSHEIRTPMNAIMGMLELSLSHHALPEQDRMQLTTAHQSAKSLLALIDDLLDLSKMEAGKLQLSLRPASLSSLVQEVADIFRPIAEGKELQLEFRANIAPGREAIHNVDPLRVKQVLNNFVSNAIRFTHKGRVEIRLEAGPIENGVQWVELSVSDTGVGIPADALDTLLDPFVQVQQTLPPADRGTGLGLSICDRLVSKMGGTIHVVSELGAGTTMIARLPLAVASVRDQERRVAPKPNVAAPDIAGLQVLVIDDQASNLLLLQRQLEKLGHEVTCASHGKEGIDLVDDGDFDLIVCDCAMPVMDGYAFTEALRARHDRAAALPILGYTAGAHEAEIARAHAVGMNEVLIKPVDLNALRQAISSVLGVRGAAAARWLSGRPAMSEDPGLIAANGAEMRR